MPPELAWAHSKTYRPWVAHWQTRRPDAWDRGAVVNMVLNVVVDRQKPPIGKETILDALRDYAQRMRSRPDMPLEDVA